ncbi:Type 1 glutamine amidotransferase-like domain-containing protein [Niallia nealsonii]|uniref:Peptidase S51 dipeptidase E n=1 Tax=Niallia nealsonii TaxID=115979 RepID=A0A2N0Z1A4_9BACI|nr:Type 1 glutamine amidotransferase-like domain-containing protein [Niallia nealsonii]PKG23296.1 peptidase S51 dipeptidase E [Niallia nealsonii]
MNQHLFLFGGGPPFTLQHAKKFINLLKSTNPISILCVGKTGWQQYMPMYTQTLKDLGAASFEYLPLPSPSLEKIKNSLHNSAGIIICGGNTTLYRDYIVDTPISQILLNCYESGIPIAGFSAGALIFPETCIISAKDNPKGEFEPKKGLGLLKNLLLAVHFSEWKDETHLLHAVNKLGEQQNYGIDENTGIYFRNGKMHTIEGKGVYTVKNKQLLKIH